MKIVDTCRWPKASYSVSSIACGGDAQARGAVAIDDQRQLPRALLLIAGDVGQLGQLRAGGRATRGAQAASSVGSASSIVYWYCVRLTRLSICRSCTACR